MSKIFLDDIRDAYNAAGYMHARIGTKNPIYLEEWIVVRNYDDFIKTVRYNIDDITHVSFDHDLGDDIAQYEFNNGLYSKRKARARKKLVKSGYDCAVWMKKFYEDKGKELPTIFIHSQNPVGVERIALLFKTG